MNRKSTKRIIFIVVAATLLIAALFAASKLFTRSSSQSTTIQSNEVKPARASFETNKEFQFPITANAKDSKSIKMVVEKVELQDEIVVRGQKASAVSGRTFLIVNLKIVNDMDQELTMDTRDYIRLSVNQKDTELLAPDIHNDPVEIQAISTKYSRVGFPVNITDKDFVLIVGEIKGEKQRIEIPFNK